MAGRSSTEVLSYVWPPAGDFSERCVGGCKDCIVLLGFPARVWAELWVYSCSSDSTHFPSPRNSPAFLMPPGRCPIRNTVGAVGRAVGGSGREQTCLGWLHVETTRRPCCRMWPLWVSTCRGFSRRSIVSLESNNDFLLLPIRTVLVGLFSELDGLELPQRSL